MLFSIGCNKTDIEVDDDSVEDDRDNETVYISVNPGSAIIPTEGGTFSTTVISSSDWTLSGDVSWCEPSKTDGNNGDNVVFKVKPNTSVTERNVTYTFRCGEESAKLTITQKQKDALTVTKSKYEVHAEGEDIQIEVKANIQFDYEIVPDSRDWITPVQSRTMTTRILTFSIAENTGTERREGEIVIRSGDLSETISVYQEGATPTIVISQDKYIVSDKGETIKVEVNSNVEYSTEMPNVEWITENMTRSVSSHTHYYTISPNETYDQRSARIIYKSKDNSALQQVVTITQVQKDALVLVEKTSSFDNDGGTLTVEVQHNVDFFVEIDESSAQWIQQVATRNMETDYLIFSISPNTSSDNREGKIVFRSKDGSIEQIHTVYQAQKNAIIISEKEINLSDEQQTFSVEVNSNVDFEVTTSGADWLHHIDTRSMVSHTLNFSVDANTTYDERTAIITVRNTQSGIGEQITVHQAQKDAIIISKKEVNLSSEQQTFSVEVKSNVDFEVMNSDAEWLHPIETKGLVSHTLNFSADANMTYDERSATITVRNVQTGIEEQITVRQAQKDAIIISEKEVNLSDERQTFSIEVNSNVDFEVSTSDADWLHPIETRSLVSHTLNFSVDANTAYDERTATITVRNTQTGIEEQITVHQAQKDAIILGKDSYIVSPEGDELDLEVMSNVNYTVTINDDWIHHVQTRALQTSTVHLTIDPCPDENQFRIGSVTLSAGYITSKITIMQISSDKYDDLCTIYYTTSDNRMQQPYMTSVFGSNLISNTYEDSQGKIVFDAPVTEIGNEAFNGCDRLTSITIPDGVLNIGDKAFYKCENLINVIIQEGVTEIGSNAFGYCYSLKNITIPKSVTKIGVSAFYYCYDLESIIIPENVEKIEDNTFDSCYRLRNVVISEGVAEIGRFAFSGCGMTSITIPESVMRIGDSVFDFCYELTAFYGKYASNDNRMLIQNGKLLAFASKGLTDYTIPSDVTLIGSHAFSGRRDLTNITIPGSVIKIGDYAFTGCSGLTDITISEGVMEIGDSTFNACSRLENITIPGSVKKIGNSAFVNCSSLTNVIISEGVVEIGDSAFSHDYYLTSIVIPGSITKIGNNAFENCSGLTNITISDGVKEIGSGAFRACSMISIAIPKSVTIIGSSAFSSCQYLTSVSISEGVNEIGGWAFAYCESLANIVIPESITVIGDYAFLECRNLTGITIPGSVIKIGDYAFNSCDHLTSISISEGVTEIGDGAFIRCTNLTDITIPGSITKIGISPFSECSNLKKVYCKASTPPSLYLGMTGLDSSCVIYVPSTAVSAYTDSWWGKIGLTIVGYDFN